MKNLLIPSAAFIGGRIIKNAAVLTESGIISGVYSGGYIPKQSGVREIPLPGLILAPGFIDIHIHGCYGYDVMDGEYALSAVSSRLAEQGVTSFCPALITAPLETIKTALAAVKNAMDNPGAGARVLGAFLEGPYINKAYKGAHTEEYIRAADLDEIKELVSIGGIKSFALAPELPGAAAAAAYLSEYGIDIRAGHSGASASDMANIDIIIHTYNAMSGLTHRSDNILSEALINDNLYAELICDFLHTTKSCAAILYRCKGADKIVLVSDSVAAAGMPNGEYRLGGGIIRLTDRGVFTADGKVAGSVLNMPAAVYNMSIFCGIENALLMATANPARAIGVFDGIGSVSVNKRADLIGFDTNGAINIKFVMKDGEIIHNVTSSA